MVEILVEKFKTEIGDTIRSVNDALEELKAERTTSRGELEKLRLQLEKNVEENLQQANETVSDALVELKTETELSKQTLGEIQTSIYTEMERSMKVINEKTENLTNIMFSARNLKNHSPTEDESMVFQTAIANIGLGYDVTTGIFTAPVQGVYLFTLQLCVRNRKYIHVEILNGDFPLLKMHFVDDYDAAWDCMATSVPAFLTSGSRVWVKAGRSADNALWENAAETWNMFSGILINK